MNFILEEKHTHVSKLPSCSPVAATEAVQTTFVTDFAAKDAFTFGRGS